MNNRVRKHYRQRIDPVPVRPSTETELRLLRATVAALQEMGLMDRDALEQARRHTPGELSVDRIPVQAHHATAR